MSYIQFDKNELINLEYSLSREIIRSNRAGSYASTTIVGCNTRKYHGLLICPLDQLDHEKHVLLSSFDETIVEMGKEFNLGIHKYEGDNYVPKGHKYIRDFEAETVARTTFRVGNVVLIKESLLVEREQQILIRYTLEDSQMPVTIRFRPFLAFRNYHTLSKANLHANTKVRHVRNGIMSRLYEGYPGLYMQFSRKPQFVHVPDWYYNIEYMRELERGYNYKEDLLVPGYFEVHMKKGDIIVFSAATKEASPESLKKKYEKELSKRIPRTSYYNCLANSAQQFIVRKNKNTEIIAGFPWFGTWGRDTFIALPGLTIAIKDPVSFIAVVDTMVKRLNNGLFPNIGSEKDPAYNTVDASLWFIWALQQLADYDPEFGIWTRYGKHIQNILNNYRGGTLYNIKMHDNGLIYAGIEGKALTWMDAIVDGVAITPRIGYPVEINALWYNAIFFSLEIAEKAGDIYFINEWKDLPERIGSSFVREFWDESAGYLVDYVDGDFKDMSVRPNQVIAAALKYSPLTIEMKKSILDVAENELLTPRGLRTLSPKNPQYKGVYEGNQEQRDLAYHQGTAWPWLLEHFCKAYLDIHKHSGLSLVKKIYEGFEEDMSERGIGSVSEVYDGDPPNQGKGTISQAWSVAALLRIRRMIKSFN
ncbi:MAG: amylo-alpha-16-glucosidase [Bacteroides sp. SM23_62_1]|nr:MAG: amylo-alpha-16-glucosidase [Bacteroides sp. SM23_62_1]